MQIYTELILGKTDPGLKEPEKTYDIGRASSDAALAEKLGFDGIVATDTKDDPFMLMTLAAEATENIALATSVAIAFPRAPFVTAQTAWSLQKLSRGRFTLGLGSQVKAHIVRRFGLDFSPMGTWMRDYVGAVRAIWDCWQNGADLNYVSDRYKLNLMVPLFNPGPMKYDMPPIHIAAVNPIMCRIAGEVGDGLRPHPMCTPRYIREVMLPAAEEGQARTGRSGSKIETAMKPLVATAATEEVLERRVADVRARVAFYASTPAYRRCFDIWGLGDLADHLSTLSRNQKWDDMPGLVDDEMLNTFAVVGSYEEVAAKLVERFSGVLDQVGFSIEVETEEDAATLSNMVREVQAG